MADLSKALTAVYGTDFGVHDPTWISRFSDATRKGGVLPQRLRVARRDAAHIHAPSGGQGIGLGIQDAVNLGWKIAQVVKGISPDSLLDTYHAERHPAEARVLQYTMAQSVTQRADPRITALADTVTDLLSIDQARAWRDRMRLAHASYDGAWELPVVGDVAAPVAVLVRPDGHVAWVGDRSRSGCEDALTSDSAHPEHAGIRGISTNTSRRVVCPVGTGPLESFRVEPCRGEVSVDVRCFG